MRIVVGTALYRFAAVRHRLLINRQGQAIRPNCPTEVTTGYRYSTRPIRSRMIASL